VVVFLREGIAFGYLIETDASACFEDEKETRLTSSRRPGSSAYSGCPVRGLEYDCEAFRVL
jgi:hypothetical protein